MEGTTMAGPARAGEGGPEPGHPDPAVLDPRKLIWADVRHGLAVQAEATGLAVGELAAHPGSGAALEMARLCLGVLETLGEMAGQWVVGEAILEAERKRAWDEGYAEGAAACKAARCRLEVVPAPR
jgi:hypothetical protein